MVTGSHMVRETFRRVVRKPRALGGKKAYLGSG